MIGNEKEGLTLIQTVILFPQTVIEEIAFWYLLLTNLFLIPLRFFMTLQVSTWLKDVMCKMPFIFWSLGKKLMF